MRNSIPCRCIGCTRFDGFVYCQISVEPSRGRTSTRDGSKPAPLICHCTRRALCSARSSRRRGVGLRQLAGAARSRLGTRNSSAPPPRSTSKRMTAVVLASPPSLRSTSCVPGVNSPKSITNSTRSAGKIGISRRRTGCSSSPPSLAICTISRPAAQREPVAARVGRVEDPEAVLAPFDPHARRDGAVDEDRVAVEAEVDVLGVAERAVAVERVVLDDERDVVLARSAARAPPRASSCST